MRLKARQDQVKVKQVESGKSRSTDPECGREGKQGEGVEVKMKRQEVPNGQKCKLRGRSRSQVTQMLCCVAQDADGEGGPGRDEGQRQMGMESLLGGVACFNIG